MISTSANAKVGLLRVAHHEERNTQQMGLKVLAARVLSGGERATGSDNPRNRHPPQGAQVAAPSDATMRRSEGAKAELLRVAPPGACNTQRPQKEDGSRALRANLEWLADAEGIAPGLLRGLPDDDIADCAGVDDKTLIAYVRALRDTDLVNTARYRRAKPPQPCAEPAVLSGLPPRSRLSHPWSTAGRARSVVLGVMSVTGESCRDRVCVAATVSISTAIR